MKILPEHQTALRTLMEAEAIKRGASSLADFFRKAEKASQDGIIRKPVKCPATFFCSFLLHGDALNYVCDVLYTYCHDAHLRTFYRHLYKAETAALI